MKEKIIAITLALLTFVYVGYQDVEQRNLFVPLYYEKIDELTFVNDLPKTVSVFVNGNRSALNNLDVNKITAKIDLTDVTSPGIVQRSPILDSLPEAIQVIRINPQVLEIELSNLEKKLLNIEPALVGKPQAGFRIRSMSVTPTRLWVFGPRDILNDLTKIETEPIDINSINQNKEINVAFSKNIHPGLKFDRDREINVLIQVESEYVKQNLIDPIQVTYDLDQRWVLEKPLMVSNISYEINKDDLSSFNIEEDLVFYFNTRNIENTGNHDVKILFKSTKKIRRVSYTPKSATVTVADQPKEFPGLRNLNQE